MFGVRQAAIAEWRSRSFVDDDEDRWLGVNLSAREGEVEEDATKRWPPMSHVGTFVESIFTSVHTSEGGIILRSISRWTVASLWSEIHQSEMRSRWERGKVPLSAAAVMDSAPFCALRDSASFCALRLHRSIPVRHCQALYIV